MDKGITVCFLARPSFDVFSTELYSYIKNNLDNCFSGIFIVSNKKEYDFVANKIPNRIIYNVSLFMKEHWTEFDLDSLAFYEKKYECAPIWKYIYSDRFLIERSYNYCVHIAVGLFRFFEKIFDDNKVDFYYSETIATLQCYIAYLVGKKRHVQYVSQMCARGNLDFKYHYFVNDEFQHDAGLQDNYLGLQYSKEEWNRADTYLSGFEKSFTPPESEKVVKTYPKINKNFVLGPIKRFIKSFDKDLNDPCSYMYYKNYKGYTNDIKFWVNFQKYKHCYISPDYSRKFVYYPLHFQPEASTCVCAEKYEKQLFFIDSLAKSLPADVVLYVKEHHAQLGHRDPHFYQEIKKYPNVFLIDPFESSRKMVEKSYAVVTLTGTVAYEAMLLRKPVIMGGSMVFDTAPGIVKANDIYGEFMNIMKNWVQPSRDDVIKYLCALFRTYKRGNAYSQNYHEYLSDNVQLLGDSLYQYLRENMN